MGLFDWLLKSGPGSPGSTAKVIVRFYKNLPNPEKDESGNIDRNHGFSEIVEIRKWGERQYGRESWLGKYDTQELVEYADGQMAILIFCIMYLESGQFRISMSSADMIKSVVNVITSVIDETLPQRKDVKGATWNFEAASWFVHKAYRNLIK